VEKGYENKPKFRGGDLFMVYLGFKNIVLPKIKWQALKNHLHFHIILESTEYFEKLSIITQIDLEIDLEILVYFHLPFPSTVPNNNNDQCS